MLDSSFVEKKDKSLHPCIAFRGLNNITIKNKYSLPLINSAFEPLHGATVFSKLDLRNAEQAVGVLKELFSISPVLIHPDTSLQFIVEVDASDLDVGAVLSQRSPTDQRLHPCAFFSKKLSPTERNYDVGNRELLGIWLDEAEQPFVVWTDHKNLAYIQATKRLNSRQARWALFFTRFNFILTYRPGSRNIKPDALSRQFAYPSETREPEAVLPSSCVVAAEQWDIESLVKAAYPGPGTGPPDLLFVPETVRSQVLQ